MTSRSTRPSPPLCALAAMVLLVAGASAETGVLGARVAGITGDVLLTNASGSAPFVLPRGYALQPGDRVDTRGGGRVVIDLSDGSLVIVQPQTVLLIKDFRAAASIRELFEIAIGAVRVKIHHVAGKPNPYRMNSPTASIAVRGTEFSITVVEEGETTVEVFEGAVEVSSLSDPAHNALIEAGRGVLVGPRGFQLYGVRIGRAIQKRVIPLDRSPRPPPATDLRIAGQAAPVPGSVSVSTAPTFTFVPNEPGLSSQTVPAKGVVVRAGGAQGPGAYDRYLASLAGVSHFPLLFRFNAFADTHLDSLDNPALATAIRQGEARLTVAPTRTNASPAGWTPAEYGIAPQVSVFQPVLQGRFVVGGSFSALQTGSATSASLRTFSAMPGATSLTFGNTNSSSTAFSSFHLIAAGRLVPGGKDSVGIGFERLTGSGSIVSETTTESTMPDQTFVEKRMAQSGIQQSRLTLGWNRTLLGRHEAGVFARYGTIDAASGLGSYQLLGRSLKFAPDQFSGYSKEIGFRIRGRIAPKLFYGTTASLASVQLDQSLPASTTEHDRALRTSAALGIGYAATPRTLLSLDAAAGTSQVDTSGYGDGLVAQQDTYRTRFTSLHAAVHRDIFRRLFASASLLSVWRSENTAYLMHPDRIAKTTVLSSAVPLTVYTEGSRFSEFGAGWRFGSGLTAQYIYGTDYGFSAASHAVVLRFTFRFHGE